MKRIIIIACAVIISAAFLGGVAVSYMGYQAYKKPGSLPRVELFVIKSGEGLTYTSERLLYIGALGTTTDLYIFRYAARLTDKHTSIKAGEYELTPQMSMEDILDLFVSGDTYQRQITFPEGLTSWQIVQILNEEDTLSGEITEIPPEGSLLPETYSYQYGDSRTHLLSRMQKDAQRVLDELWESRAENLPFDTKAEALVLASIIEKETGVAEERERVSGVFVNRLRKGMKLQSDPTTIYAMTMGRIEDQGQGPIGRRLLKVDLKIDSPYNTYAYKGLPPAPIANSGRESIAAALQPETHDYLYFVADGEGGHAFAKTLSQHNRNVAAWRKIRRAKNN